MADHPAVFVVPGVDIAYAQGINLPLPLAATPREASILLLVPPLTEKLAEKAAVAFAQMPRPRLILSVGVETVAPLPPPDIIVADPGLLADGFREAQHLLATHSWSQAPTAYEPAILTPEADEEPSHDHSQMSGHHHSEHDTEASDEGKDKSSEHQHNKEEQGQEHHQHEHQGHGGHDHGGGGGMMSMEMMTKDLPRSADGLPMDWNETHLGPFFPGLPGGLALHAQLDGDTVAQIDWMKGLTTRQLAEKLPGDVSGFPERLAAVSIFSPVAYRTLAERALEQLSGQRPSPEQHTQRIGAVEKERIRNHLNGLVRLGIVIGNQWLERQSCQALANFQQDAPSTMVQDALERLIHRIRKLPFLRQKLQGMGGIPPALLPHTRGPVRRASHQAYDLRMDEPAYQALAFQLSQQDGNDAWSRLLVRLGELEESLRLVRTIAGKDEERPQPSAEALKTLAGTGQASIETARGAAHLSLTVEAGAVRQATLDVPSFHHLALVAEVAAGQELGDALVGIHSLDLSPWEVDQ